MLNYNQSKIVPPFGKAQLLFRITKATLGNSKSGKLMFTVNAEVCGPKEFQFQGTTYEFLGEPVTMYIMAHDNKSKEKLLREKGILDRLKVSKDIDESNPDLTPWLGIVFAANASAREEFKGKVDETGNFVHLTDPETGEKISDGVKISVQADDILYRDKTLETVNVAF